MDDTRQNNPRPDERPIRIPGKAEYQKHRDSFRAMRRVLPITVDIPSLITRSLGALAGLGPLREEALSMPRVDRALGELTEEYLQALLYAHARYATRFRPPAVVREMFADLLARKEKILVGAAALEAHGVVRPLTKPSGTQSRAAHCMAAIGLANALLDEWGRIAGKTAITRRDLEELEELAAELLTALGARPAEDAEDIIHMRQAAFTMFVRAYDQLRRGVAHIRWDEGDLEEILPTPYVGRHRPKKAAKEKAAKAAMRMEPANENPDLANDDDWPFRDA